MARITNKNISILDNKLDQAVREDDVRDAWRELLTHYYINNNDTINPTHINSPFNQMSRNSAGSNKRSEVNP